MGPKMALVAIFMPFFLPRKDDSMNLIAISLSAGTVLALVLSATGHADEAEKPIQLALRVVGEQPAFVNEATAKAIAEAPAKAPANACDPRESLRFCARPFTGEAQFKPQASVNPVAVPETAPQPVQQAETPLDPNERTCILKMGGRGQHVWRGTKPAAQCEAELQASKQAILNPPKPVPPVTAQAPATVQVASVGPTPVVADLRPSLGAPPLASAAYVAPVPVPARRMVREAPAPAYTASAYLPVAPLTVESQPASAWYANLGLGGVTGVSSGRADQFLVGGDIGKAYRLTDNIAGIVRAGGGVALGDNGSTVRYEGSLQAGFGTTLGKGFTPYGLVGVRGNTGPKVSTWGPTGTVGVEFGSFFTEYGLTYYLQPTVPGGSQYAQLVRVGITSPLDWRWGSSY